MKQFAKNSEVSFVHPITKKVMTSRVYDVCYQGDPTTWAVSVKVADGNLVWKLCSDCQEVK